MNKLTKEKRDKLVLVAIGTGAALAALYLMVISAQQTALGDYQVKTDSARQKLEKAELWQRMAPGIQTKLSAGRKELEAKQEGMAPVDKFKWFYNTLEQFLTPHKVKLVDITREPEVSDVGVLPKFPYQAATFGVKLLAPFHDFGAFLAEFENQFPYMRVQNLEIEPDGGSKFDANEAPVLQSRPRASANLAVTMRVVTLVKPRAPL